MAPQSGAEDKRRSYNHRTVAIFRMFPKKETYNKLEVVVQSTFTSQPPSASASLQNSSVGMVLLMPHNTTAMAFLNNLGSVVLHIW